MSQSTSDDKSVDMTSSSRVLSSTSRSSAEQARDALVFHQQRQYWPSACRCHIQRHLVGTYAPLHPYLMGSTIDDLTIGHNAFGIQYVVLTTTIT